MGGFTRRIRPGEGGAGGIPHKPGHILHDVLETRVMPDLTGPVGRGKLQYTAIWKAAQRLTAKPVKFGTITPELIAMAVRDQHYKDLRKGILAISDALNAELHELADAGCKVIQMEEPQIHLLAAKGLADKVLNPEFMVEGVQQHRARACAPRPRSGATPAGATRRRSACSPKTPSYAPALER